MRVLPAGFVPCCLPTKVPQPSTGDAWLHEIEHHGYRLMARRDSVGIRLASGYRKSGRLLSGDARIR